jgi:general stress protein 26
MTKLATSTSPLPSGDTHLNDADARSKLFELMNGTRFVAFTAQSPDGGLRSRPLTLLELDSEARLWFFVDRTTEWVRDLEIAPIANLTMSNEKESTWVSMCGIATLVQDSARVKRLWTAAAKPFFNGPDDSRLALLCVPILDADYWDAPDSRLVRLLGMARAAITGSRPDVPGSHGTMTIPQEISND